MVSSNAIILNPTIIPEYATNDNRVSSNDTTLKENVSPDCGTNINWVNKNSITKVDIYEDNNYAESVSSNESYDTLWVRRNKNTSQVTFDNLLN